VLPKLKRKRKEKKRAWRQWLTPVILATQEAEIRRIKIQSQTQTNISRDPISKIPNTKKGWRSGSSDKVPA
jgi:hypothetical protein